MYTVKYRNIFLSGWSATSRELTSSTRASSKWISTTNGPLEDINWQSQMERCFVPVTLENKDIFNDLLWLLTSHTVFSWAKLTTYADNVLEVWSVVTLDATAAAVCNIMTLSVSSRDLLMGLRSHGWPATIVRGRCVKPELSVVRVLLIENLQNKL